QGREGERADPQADGRGRQLHPDAGPAGGQAVAAGGRGRVLDLGPRHGGDGAYGARQGEGGREGGAGGAARHARDGGDGRRDVPQVDGRGDGGRQRRAAASWHREGRHRARGVHLRAQVGEAAQEVQGLGVRAVEGGGRAAHAVLQRLPAAVLLPDDGRDGSGDAADGPGDGDAGRQRGHGGGADHADRDG